MTVKLWILVSFMDYVNQVSAYNTESLNEESIKNLKNL